MRGESGPALAELGVDELVLMEATPDGADAVPGWIAGSAKRWMSAL